MLSISLLALILSIVYADSPTLEDGVHVLTDANFEPFITANDFTLVKFYAPWCGHCKSLAPIYTSAAKSALENNINVPFAKMDCTDNKQICELSQIQGYPSIKLFSSSGKSIDFEGERDEATILAFIQKKTGPPSQLLNSADSLAEFLSQVSNPRVVAYIEESSESYPIYKEIAGHSVGLDNFLFGHVEKSLWGEHKEGSIDLLVGDVTFTYTGSFDVVGITSFLMANGFPIVDALTQDSWTRAQNHPTGKVLVSVFYDKDGQPPSFLESVATAYQSKLVFTVSDATQILDRWGGSGRVLPSACLINFNGENPELFTWNEESGVEFTEESLSSFIDLAMSGTYETNLKSEPIPEQSSDDTVTIIVGKTLNQIINDETKDVVLVDFYAPWCGHCKKLNPIYDELGAHFTSNANVVIAKIDATANSLPKDLQVQGYPTIIAFAKGERHVYSGSQELEPLIQFVNSIVDGSIKEASESKGERKEDL